MFLYDFTKFLIQIIFLALLIGGMIFVSRRGGHLRGRVSRLEQSVRHAEAQRIGV